MVASILIIVFSVALFIYWFRYTCLLILSARTARDYTRQVADANQLGFLDVQSQLATVADLSFDSVHRSLARDYKLITYLLSHAGNLDSEDNGLEQLMLRIDFKLMSVWSALSSRVAPAQARNALVEMSDIISHFANTMGERQAADLAA
jgi:hypothetical protein